LTSSGIDYNKIFASVVKPETAYMPLAYAAAYDLEVEWINECPSFMYTDVHEEVNIRVLALHSFGFWL
jgi:hypothetical protein